MCAAGESPATSGQQAVEKILVEQPTRTAEIAQKIEAMRSSPKMAKWSKLRMRHQALQDTAKPVTIFKQPRILRDLYIKIGPTLITRTTEPAACNSLYILAIFIQINQFCST